MSIYRDAELLTANLVDWLKNAFAEAHLSKAVLGISGGIDSAVLAVLLCRALGKENVTGVIMPCHSMQKDEDYALLLARKFGFNVVKVDLTKTFDVLKSEMLNATQDNLTELALANIKPRLRMTTLFAIAQSQGALVCGGSNKDEIYFGYFTKYGDSGVDLMPIADLLKGEVFSLARYLGVPQEIIDRPPTAALWDGQTDESEMGITYDELDKFIATGAGSDFVKQKAESAFKHSAHKREFAKMAKINL